MSRKGVRRAYIEDSFESRGSRSGRSSAASNANGNSFLSEDRSSSESFKSCQSSPGNKSRSTSPTAEETEDSFIVKDTSVVTLNSTDSSVEILDSPAPPPRKQPLRSAKVNFDAPKTDPSPWPCTPVLSSKPAPFLSCRKASKKTRNDANTSVLDTVTDPEERQLLLELYPELADEDQQSDGVASLSGDEEQEEEMKEPRPKLFDSIIEESPDEKSPAKSGRNSPLSEDDSFDRYLNFLKSEKKAQKELDSDEEVNDKDRERKFVVSDSESVEILSSNDDDEYDDEEEEEDVEEEDEEEDDEEENKENIPVPKKSVVNRTLASSLRADFASPSLKKSNTKVDQDDFFLASLSADFNGVRHKDAVKFAINGFKTKRLREELTDRVFEIIKRRCFDDQIPMERSDVNWSGRLRTTAGHCKNSFTKGTATIELSVKVCTTPERLRDTLVHEMCHAAAWLIDKALKAGHGPIWRNWTDQCRNRCPSLPPVGVCHSYKIEKKFVYVCNGCGQSIGRHSKSLDIKKLRCGICHEKFFLTKNGQIVNEEQPKTNKFAMFVKEHYGQYKKEGVKHAEVMKVISDKWKKMQNTDKNSNDVENPLELSVLSLHED